MRDMNDITREIEKINNQIVNATNIDNVKQMPVAANAADQIFTREPVFAENAEKKSAVSADKKINSQVLPPCNIPCSREVLSCCNRNLPIVFDPFSERERRIIFDVTKLRCFAEECQFTVTTPQGCPSPIKLKAFRVRVVGCIPYLVSSFPVIGQCGGDLFAPQGNTASTDRMASACCGGCASVDNVLCYKASREEAEAACPALNCQTVSASVSRYVFRCVNGAGWDIEYDVTFRLPSCAL